MELYKGSGRRGEWQGSGAGGDLHGLRGRRRPARLIGEAKRGRRHRNTLGVDDTVSVTGMFCGLPAAPADEIVTVPT